MQTGLIATGARGFKRSLAGALVLAGSALLLASGASAQVQIFGFGPIDQVCTTVFGQFGEKTGGGCDTSKNSGHITDVVSIATDNGGQIEDVDLGGGVFSPQISAFDSISTNPGGTITTLGGTMSTGTLTVDGDTTLGTGFTDKLIVNATSTFTSDATFDGNVTIGGVLTAGNGTITNLTSTNGTITNLTSTNGTITNLTSTNGTITNLTSTNATVTNLTATNADITNLTATNADITNLTATNGTITNLTSTNADITNLTATNGTITNLTSTNATVTNLTATNGTIGTLGVTGDATVGGNLTVTGTTTTTSIVNSGNIATDTLTANHITTSGLTVTPGSPVDMGGNVVHGVAAPIVGTDAANKQYVDDGLAKAFKEIDRNTQGIAIAMAMAGLTLPDGKNFALGANMGFFDDKQAIAIQAAIRLSPNLTLTGGFGTGVQDVGTTGGRVGIQAAW